MSEKVKLGEFEPKGQSDVSRAEKTTCLIKSATDLLTATPTNKYEIKVDLVSDAIKTGDITQIINVQRADNKGYVEHYNELIQKIIPIHSFKPKKLIIPVIPKIQIENTDTLDIKKMIRKTNLKTQSFTCDHTKHDKKYDSFESDIGKVYLMKEKKEVDTFMSDLARVLLRIEEKDSRNKSAHNISENIMLSDIKKVNDKIIAINNELIQIESFYKSLTCHKCDHIVKLHAATVEIVNEMREEIREEMELSQKLCEEADEDIAEDKYSIVKFMQKHYPTIERLPLKDICDKYKEVFGIKKTLLEMKAILEEQTNYKISNVSRKYFVTKP